MYKKRDRLNRIIETTIQEGFGVNSYEYVYSQNDRQEASKELDELQKEIDKLEKKILH